jgi:hypothetical protein
MLPLLLGFLIGQAHAESTVVLYTMGQGDDLLSRWGHAMLCVRVDLEKPGLCYDYGHTDYSSPPKLIWEFMRKKGLYWAEVVGESKMQAHYRKRNQTIHLQKLPLSGEQADTLARMLHDSRQGDQKYYVYHHFYDNCATRLRDPLDKVLNGTLSRDTQEPDGPSYRELAEQGLSGFLPLQIALQLGLGREADIKTSPWQRMFMPDELRKQVEEKLGAKPQTIFYRVADPLPDSPNEGRWTVAATGTVGLGLTRLRNKWGLRLLAGLLGLPALMFWGLACITAITELRWNEALLLLWPMDLALPWLGKRYVWVRLVGVAVVGVLWAVGVLVQPLAAVLCLVGLPFLGLGWKSLKGSG